MPRSDGKTTGKERKKRYSPVFFPYREPGRLFQADGNQQHLDPSNMLDLRFSGLACKLHDTLSVCVHTQRFTVF